MQDYTKPTLPLSQEGFRRAVRVGHGRARMHLEVFGTSPFRGDLLEAAAKCGVYDPQVDSLPASWFVDLCELGGVVDEVIEQGPGESHWDGVWRCELLKEMATRGKPLARQALYNGCRPADEGGFCGADQIMELDGTTGLLFVARQMASHALVSTAFELDSHAFWTFDHANGEGSALRFLRSFASEDLALKAFVDRLGGLSRDVHPATTRPRRSLAEMITYITEAQDSIVGAGYWGRRAEPLELEQVLALALSSQDTRVLENSLRCLSGASSFRLPMELLSFTTHADPNVRLFASRTVGRHIHPDIRVAGLAALNIDLHAALALLRVNATPQDVPAIRANLLPIDDHDRQHDIVFALVDLIEDNDALGDPSLAAYVYERSPCQNCRTSAVQKLTTWRTCPGWILEEAKFDACEEVRKLVSDSSGTT